LIDICDTCGRLGELSQLPGRSDCNCVECNGDISKLGSLYGKLKNAEPHSEHEAYLQKQIIPVLHRLLARFAYAEPQQFCAWPQGAEIKQQVN